MKRRLVAVPLGVGLMVSCVFAADEKKVPVPKAPKVQAARPAARPNQGNQPKPQQQQPAAPGEQLFDRLVRMSPEEREKALQGLPEPRRQNLERRLNEAAKMPPTMRNGLRPWLEKLNSLPDQRRNQVRRSLNQFGALPEDRKNQMNDELRRMAPMQDEERRAYLNTEEIRNKYSPTEQQILSNLSEIQP